MSAPARNPLRGQLHDVVGWSLTHLDDTLGGPARRHVLLLLAGVLGLAAADQATIGASATQLRDSLHISHTGIGLIAAVSGVVAAVVGVPLGSLVDRVNRTRLLAVGIAAWAVAMAVSAAAQSFEQLLLTRCALGATVAIAAPATASLIGDYFAPHERARIWGYVLAGELVGTGFGFTVAGELASITWRASFLALGLPACALSYLMFRLPEPDRGGVGRIAEGAVDLTSNEPADPTASVEPLMPTMSESQRRIHAAVPPYEDKIITDDPSGWPLWKAVTHVLRIRTNVILIIAGSAGYFFFAGVRTFGIEYVKPQYGIGQGVASMLTLVLGVFAIAGVLASGSLSDRLAARGYIRARVYVGASMLGVGALAFLPALLVNTLGFGLMFLGLAAVALAAANPPLDAGRLDIMYPTLWGRAEAIRTLVKQPAEALAPLLFGLLADHLFGGGHVGLRAAFLIMLVPLLGAVFVTLKARNSYPRDVATAAASIERTSRLTGRLRF